MTKEQAEEIKDLAMAYAIACETGKGEQFDLWEKFAEKVESYIG